jgi:hypothetical protein
MKPLGVDLGVVEASRLEADPTPDCPGAKLRISRAEYDALAQAGERFTSARQDIPYDGLGDARVACTAKVARLVKTASNAVQYYGLCHSCSGLEADNRHSLRSRAQSRGER